jgi:hypothetical protein
MKKFIILSGMLLSVLTGGQTYAHEHADAHKKSCVCEKHQCEGKDCAETKCDCEDSKAAESKKEEEGASCH